jgi:1-acyl-sn-glycerol-3-phosphate acyltransferase
VPAEGPVIITANHTASPDPLMISAACRHRRISFMIAREFANIPVARIFIRMIDCIPVRRDGIDTAATKTAIRRLREGDALGIFIEGRIARPGEAIEPKHGVAMLALRTGATVIPAYLSGNKHRSNIVKGLLARHNTTIRFGPPVDLSEFKGDTSRESLSAATAKIFQAIQAPRPA